MSRKYKKIGIKLFSSNVEAAKAAAKLHEKKLIDYIELMALPNSYQKTINCWREIGVPFIIHAPHSKQGFNLSLESKLHSNLKMFKETKAFADALKAKYIIIHPGLLGEIDETIKQIKRLNDSRLIIENNPFISLFQTKCVGFAPIDINRAKKEAGIGFCLDITHAIKAANAIGADPYEYLRSFCLIAPVVVHVCDCSMAGAFDEHRNLGRGGIDYYKVVKYLNNIKHSLMLTLEVPEKNYQTLKGTIADVLKLKVILA